MWRMHALLTTATSTEVWHSADRYATLCTALDRRGSRLRALQALRAELVASRQTGVPLTIPHGLC